VTSSADDGSAGTLRAVLAAAQNGDAIAFDLHLQGQTIILTQGQLTVSQSVDIEGPGAPTLAISGGAASRVFDITPGVTVRLVGLRITGGLATDGAGILNEGHLTLFQDLVAGNVAQGVSGGGLFGDGGGRGGGVENQTGATLTVLDSRFAGDLALGSPNGGSAFGGGLYNEAGTVTIDLSAFMGNQAVAGNGGAVGVAATLPGGLSATLLGVGAGGGIWNDGGALTVANSAFSNNLAQGGSDGDASASTALLTVVGTATGGAIGDGAFFTTATPSLAIRGSTLNRNQSHGGTNVVDDNLFTADAGTGRGGAIGSFAGNVTVATSTLSSNLAEGGALFTANGPGSLVFVTGGSTFGGGIDDELDLGFSSLLLTLPASPSLGITDSTISGNVALGNGPSGLAEGGGLITNTVNAQVSNSTVIGNQALGAPGGGFEVFYGFFFALGGGGAQAGGIESGGGSLTISGSTLKDNLAQAGPGGPAVGGQFGSGGFSSGGAIDSSAQVLVLTNSILSGNQSVAGDADQGSYGGEARGGALSMTLDSSYFGTSNSATISGTAFINNLAQGGANNTGFFGGLASGGAITDFFFSSLQLSNSMFVGNVALGGAGKAGGNGGAGGLGGPALGGALRLDVDSSAAISNTAFVRNVAQGGPGGAGNSGDEGGPGGSGGGGALNNTLSAVTVSSSSFIQNVAQGGAGGTGGAGANGGPGGDSGGGAVFGGLAFEIPLTASIAVSNSSIIGNQAIGGAGGAGGTGGNGGNATGGAFLVATGGLGPVTLMLSGDTILDNTAAGGAGASGGNGGNGQGGGLFIDTGATATVHTTVIAGNQAVGGAAGAGGSAGQGIGGGIYTLGTFFLDAASLIAGNHASTSDNNVFGTITPI
jgi:hypothetical protein